MLLVNRALLLVVFMMGTFVKKLDLVVQCESIPMQHDDPGLNYEDTREFYSVRSLKKANNDSSFIKLVFVVDQRLSKAVPHYNNTISRYCQGILRFANSFFQPYNIFIALVDIIIWAEKDEIDIVSNDATITYTRFETYARNLFKDNHSVDHVILLAFKLDQITQSYVTQLENMDKKCNLFIRVMDSYVADEWMGAELIFYLGDGYQQIETETDFRKCFKPKYVKTYESEFLLYFDNPTEYKYKHCIDKFMNETTKMKTNLGCLKTKPDILYKKPVCGNNITEPGEECDCTHQFVMTSPHYKRICNNQCCDPVTCRINKTISYSCAFGECCDLNSCTTKLKKDAICRPASHRCDVEEYCDGESAFCPKDKFVNDSRECAIGECHFESMNDEVVFDQGTTEYKGVCNSKGLCQCKKKIFSPIYKTNTIDTTTTIPCDVSIFSKCYCPDSPWKTYFFILSAVILVGGIILLSVYIHNTYMKKYRSRFHNKDQQRQTYNSSLRNGTINELSPVNEDIQRLTETADSLIHQEHEYDELNTPSNIYENPTEIHQQGSDNYGYTIAHSCPSTTSSGYTIPTATNSDNQQNIDDIYTIAIPKQQAPGYYENCDKSNNILDPIYEDCLYDEANHPQNIASSAKNHKYITIVRPLSTTSSGYQIPITSNSNNRQNIHATTKMIVPDSLQK